MQTKSLSLQRLTREDYGWLCALYADPEIMEYIGTGVRTFEVASGVLDKMLAAPPPAGYWTLRDRQTGEPLGAGMLMIRHEGSPLEVGFLLAKRAWGRGLATEATRALLRHAFTELNVPLVEAYTDTRNDASAKVLLKAGFRDAGITAGPYGTPDRRFSAGRDEWMRSSQAT
ncbi:MAG TPA: GNAT family N-acetyltransferase [Myxococcales bacterium]|jgi:RimJ/RimL family protein N-acetyltransferase|nr:GNAT family N-acetyltransferase [Myxococcales bacterium]